MLAQTRRFDEALAEIRKAQELDPLSPIINASLGDLLLAAGQADQAGEVLKKQIALDPSFVVAHQNLGYVYLAQGRLSDAIAEFETMHRLDASGTYDWDGLGFAYGRAGRTDEARQVLARLQEIQRQGLDCRVSIAIVLHGLGDDEGALTWLEEALAQRSHGLEWLNSTRHLNDLRLHPRVQAILRRMNLVK